MTSAPSAEPTTSTPGPSDSLTVGAKAHVDTVQMVIGKLGIDRGLGSFERALREILYLNGMSEESMLATSQEIMEHAWALLQAALALYISDTASQKTELPKPKNTSTSESPSLDQIPLW